MKFEIKNTEVLTFSGNAKSNGRPFTIRKQEAWVDTGKAYPERVEVMLKDDQHAYPVGNYTLAKDSIYVDRNGRLAIAPRLVPASPATAAAAATDRKAG